MKPIDYTLTMPNLLVNTTAVSWRTEDSATFLGVNANVASAASHHLDGLLTALGVPPETRAVLSLSDPRELTEAGLFLLDELTLRTKVATQLTYRRGWRYYCEQQSAYATLGVCELSQAALYRFEVYLDSLGEGINADIPVYQLARKPGLLKDYITRTWAGSSQALYFGSFRRFLIWGVDQIIFALPLSLRSIPSLRDLYPVQPVKKVITTSRKRAVLTVPWFFKILDRIMTDPEFEDMRPNAWVNFCDGARPFSEASPGGTEAIADFNEHFVLRVRDFRPKAKADYGAGFYNKPINKRMKGMAAARGAHRHTPIFPQDKEYLMPILDPLLALAKQEKGGAMRPFATLKGQEYSRRLFDLIDSMNPLVRVEGYDGEIPWKEARTTPEINVRDIVRATRNALVETYLVETGMLPAHQAQKAVKYRMGHGETTPTYELHYQGLITEEDIEFFEGHHAPEFTYDPNHSNRAAFVHAQRVALGEAAFEGYHTKYESDPDFKATAIAAQQAGRKRDPGTGKCIVPAASLANLDLRPGITPQCSEAALATMKQMEEEDPFWRRQVVAKSVETRRRNGGGKIVASEGSLRGLAVARAKRKAARAAGIGKMGYLGVPFTAVPKEKERLCFAPPIFVPPLA